MEIIFKLIMQETNITLMTLEEKYIAFDEVFDHGLKILVKAFDQMVTGYIPVLLSVNFWY